MNLANLELYQELEDEYECSGMCRPGLFYFGRDISNGPPKKTCLSGIQEVVDEAAKPWAICAMIAAFVSLILFFLHFAMYFRPEIPNQ